MKAQQSRLAGAALANLTASLTTSLTTSLFAGFIATFIAASPTHANTIKFETIAPDGGLRNVNPNRPLHTDGYMISDMNGESAVFSATSGYSMIGDPTAIFGFAASDTITLSHGDGGAFDLVRLLLGPSNIGSGTTDITLTGYGIGSTIVDSITFMNLTTATLETLRWDDLSRVTITATTDSSVDEIVVRRAARPADVFTAVPEPASVAILAAGLIGLGTRKRRPRALQA